MGARMQTVTVGQETSTGSLNTASLPSLAGPGAPTTPPETEPAAPPAKPSTEPDIPIPEPDKEPGEKPDWTEPGHEPRPKG